MNNFPIYHILFVKSWAFFVHKLRLKNIFNMAIFITSLRGCQIGINDPTFGFTNGLQSIEEYINIEDCRNPSFGLATKARACKVAGQEGTSGGTLHAPGSAKECEGMNPHILK
jgi:hypothetical protein